MRRQPLPDPDSRAQVLLARRKHQAGVDEQHAVIGVEQQHPSADAWSG